MTNISTRFAANLEKLRNDNAATYEKHRSLLLLAEVCLDDANDRNSETITMQAIAAIGNVDEVALSIFELKHQIGLCQGMALLRSSSYQFSDAFNAKVRSNYEGIAYMFKCIEIEMDTPEGRDIMDILTTRVEYSIMSHLIFA
ncbi:hypothetical protein [Vibrio parahaemolyticus]|uniref:hypothetical protein n=1 Tax=Vibrio parahaemolyticus TaxID=670 RepID=UPI002269EDF7|nr:hypothetical protein [Vibrio parahaemolyticus]MCX8796165.1 hypothetical protein [Vibrio parahaemolyticus]